MKQNLSILIITYNRPQETLDLLKSIRAQEGVEKVAKEILILNNASTTDYTVVKEYIKAEADLPFQYIDSDENLGVARGRNLLIEKAKGDYLLVLDDDIEFDTNTGLKQISGLFDQPFFAEKPMAVITLSVFYYSTRQRQKNALPHKKYQTYKHKEHFLTYYFAGGAHVIKKEVFAKTGLYPTNFFYGMEEYDLSYRIIDAGYALGYDARVKVLHKESPEGRVPSHEKLQMLWYNKSVVAYRYLPKIYFYSTAMMWGFEYLKKTKGDLSGAFKTLNKISKISNFFQRKPIGAAALAYLKRVKARLWY